MTTFFRLWNPQRRPRGTKKPNEDASTNQEFYSFFNYRAASVAGGIDEDNTLSSDHMAKLGIIMV